MNAWLRIFGVLLLALVVSCGGKKVKKKRTDGYHGEARANPFLAAQRLLESQGRDAELQATLGELDSDVGMIFITPSVINTQGRADAIIDWVAYYGGHVVLMVDGGRMGGNDFSQYHESRSWVADEPSQGLRYFYDYLDLDVVGWGRDDRTTSSTSSLSLDDWEAMSEKDRVLLGSQESTIKIAGQSFQIAHWSDYGVKYEIYDSEDFGSSGDGEDKHRFLSMGFGEGRVTVLSDARPIRNRFIGEKDHAAFLTILSKMTPHGKVVFTRGKGDSFMEMVWRHFKWAVIALGVAIAFWLWKNLPRFGPEKTLEVPQLREFSQQLRGEGRFFWMQKHEKVLLGAMRQRILRQMGVGQGGQHEGAFEQLAASSGLTQEEVIEAMTRDEVRDPTAMTRMVKNLQTITNQL